MIGTRLGPYEIVAPLGAGGMGEVHGAQVVSEIVNLVGFAHGVRLSHFCTKDLRNNTATVIGPDSTPVQLLASQNPVSARA
jgi:hypothetical protein